MEVDNDGTNKTGNKPLTNLDLFGGETPVIDQKPTGWAEVKRIRKYRLAENKDESCKTCKQLVRKQLGNTYFKCALMTVMGSASSDIRLKNTCDLWQIH